MSLISLPPELRLYIIYKACTYSKENLQTLKSLTLIFRAFNIFISVHRTSIIEHYTKIEENNDYTRWMLCGQPHRGNDLPAIIYTSGVQCWYQHGQKHRDNDLPAIIYADGSQFWYQHDQIRRDNGLPAAIYANGTVEYWVNGVKTH